MMRSNTMSCGLSGARWRVDKYIPHTKIAFFHMVSDQDWSPSVTERRHERGIKICNLRFGVSWTELVWKDKGSPHTEFREF